MHLYCIFILLHLYVCKWQTQLNVFTATKSTIRQIVKVISNLKIDRIVDIMDLITNPLEEHGPGVDILSIVASCLQGLHDGGQHVQDGEEKDTFTQSGTVHSWVPN